MGIGDILSGLSAAAGGYETGVQNRKELERQARQQLLAQQLAQGNLDVNRQRLGLEAANYKSEADRRAAQTDIENRRLTQGAGKLQHLVDPVTGQVYGYDPVSNTIVPATESDISSVRAATPGKPARINPPPKFVPYTTAEGGTGVARLSPGGGVVSQTPLGEKPLNAQERTAGSQVESASGSVDAMRQIAQRNPGAVQEALGAIKAGHIPIVGGLIGEARGALTSADAQTFYENYKNFLLSVTPTYGGARPTKQLLDLEESATLPALSSGDFTTAFATMQHRLSDLRAKARLPGAPTPTAPAPVQPKKPAVNSRYWHP